MCMYDSNYDNHNGAATVALVLSIFALCLCLIPWINNLAIVLGGIAVIIVFFQSSNYNGRKRAISAIIIGILAITLTVNYQSIIVFLSKFS